MEAGDASAALDPKLAPLLLFGHGDATFLYSVPTRALLPMPMPRGVGDGVDDMMRGHRWWTTAQGWLLMARHGSPCTFLWDPFTGRRVGLPPDHDGTILAAEGSHRRRCLLSCCGPMDPTSCVVLVVDLADPEIWYCHPGDNHWVKRHQHPYQYRNPGHRDAIITGLRHLTAIDGKFYTDLNCHVCVLEFSPNLATTLTAIGDDDRRPAVYKKRTTSFLESNGELHSVVFSHPVGCDRIVARVGVYRLSMATTTQEQKSAWVKVDSLGGRAFFVHIGGFGASLDAEGTGLRGNCVYYSGFNGKVLCVYNMERGTTAVIDPGVHLPSHQSPQVLMPTFPGYYGSPTRSVEEKDNENRPNQNTRDSPPAPPTRTTWTPAARRRRRRDTGHLVLAHKLFLLSHPDADDDFAMVALRSDVLRAVKSDGMAPMFEWLAAGRRAAGETRARIDEEVRKLDGKIADAEENLGEIEVREAHLAKSLYFIRVREKVLGGKS